MAEHVVAPAEKKGHAPEGRMFLGDCGKSGGGGRLTSRGSEVASRR